MDAAPRPGAAPASRAPLQKTRLDFWLPKPEGSRLRDKRELGEPDAMGWEALVLCWVCDLRVSNLDWVARPVISFVDSGEATT